MSDIYIVVRKYQAQGNDMEFYPLSFEPIFQSYIWGGRRLETALGKSLPADGKDYAESWEVVDHDDGQSIVAAGPLQGTSLAQLVREHGQELLGKHHPQSKFPLLFKFLDCQRNLSVQVHPNDQQGSLLDPPDLGKTEAWVIMAAEPGSQLYAGLKSGVDRDQFERELRNGTAESCLHVVEPAVGDCIFIPAGTVHALAEGLVVAEIQQSSNTTFRLYDWNRVDAEGKSRPLHIEQGLAVTDFERGPVDPQEPQIAADGVERLVSCEKFVLDRRNFQGSTTIGGDDACHIVAVLKSSVQCGDFEFPAGKTFLLPAACGEVTLVASSDAILLDMYLP